ncbi:hypothetical protein GCM10019016_098220 [Streptomyces prasinosporus]|uniref:Acyl-CoA carboxylase subunit epsilon n=1 Tax=Streptomyces prasinosporus TaxID=68256 RepID=A0ABP6U4U0_9ACTN
MRAGETSRAEAVALVQRIMDAHHASDEEPPTGWTGSTQRWRVRPDTPAT